MIISITCALVTAILLSMLWSSTRLIGIISVSVLAFLYPIPVLALVLVGIGLYYWRKIL